MQSASILMAELQHSYCLPYSFYEMTSERENEHQEFISHLLVLRFISPAPIVYKYVYPVQILVVEFCQNYLLLAQLRRPF